MIDNNRYRSSFKLLQVRVSEYTLAVVRPLVYLLSMLTVRKHPLTAGKHPLTAGKHLLTVLSQVSALVSNPVNGKPQVSA
jgi:hypothetical protein